PRGHVAVLHGRRPHRGQSRCDPVRRALGADARVRVPAPAAGCARPARGGESACCCEGAEARPGESRGGHAVLRIEGREPESGSPLGYRLEVCGRLIPRSRQTSLFNAASSHARHSWRRGYFRRVAPHVAGRSYNPRMRFLLAVVLVTASLAPTAVAATASVSVVVKAATQTPKAGAPWPVTIRV